MICFNSIDVTRIKNIRTAKVVADYKYGRIVLTEGGGRNKKIPNLSTWDFKYDLCFF